MNDYYPKKSVEIDEILQKRYGLSDFEVSEPETDLSLVARINNEAQNLNKKIINKIPTKLIQDTLDFEPIPQYQFPSWPELENNFELYGIHNSGVMLAAPSIWQYVYPFQYMVQRHKLFLARSDKNNTPLIGEIIRQAKISCLVTYEEAARQISQELRERKINNILKLVVITRGLEKKKGGDNDYNFGSAAVLWDMQVFPGHTIAYQTFGNSGDADCFHLSSRYLWRFTKEATYITGIDETVLPLFNYRLPLVAEPVSLNTKVPAFKFTYV